jgi:metal-sulfur cluster biosynthetic enzyme
MPTREEVFEALHQVEDPWTPERMSDDAKFILGFG